MANRLKDKLAKSRRKRPSSNVHTTKSGKQIKLQQTLMQKYVAHKDGKELRKAQMLRDMPKGRINRIIYRLKPSRMYHYWFSKEGGIMALKVTGIGLISMFVLLVGLFAYFRKDLPNIKDISGDNIGGSIRYYDKTGQTLLWEDYDAVKRIPVEGDKINQYMKDAMIAIEDRDFYNHGGFDVKAIARAGVANLTGGSKKQGGSTITQQLIKVTQDWTKDKSYTRKIKELILSVELERSYSKDEILIGYLNAAPFGTIQYGVEAASRDYFNKSAKDLTLDEAAFLAGIPNAPGYYSPYGPRFKSGGQQASINRQHYTLDIMYDMGKITKQQRDDAKKVDTVAKVRSLPAKYGGIIAPHFVLTAKEQLENQLQDENTYKRGGWKVTTTLDLNLQKLAEEQVAKGMAQIQRQGGNVAAFVAEDVETGQVVALVGGPDFTNKEYGQNNYARAPLSPGSSIKPYDYAALFENTTNSGAGSVLYDTQGPLPGYPCTNKALPPNGNCLHDVDRRYPGPITVRYALAGSRNVPAVKAMLTAGVDKTLETAAKIMNPGNGNAFEYHCYKSGTTDFIKENRTQCGGAAGIGDGAYLKLDEHVHGYSTLSRNGVNIPQTYILKIESGNNKVLDEWEPSAGEQVIKADTAYILNDILSDPNPSYFRVKPQRFKGNQGTWKFALKTGTTNDAKDAWLVGHTTKYAAGVWAGYYNSQKSMSGSMESMTLPIWQGWMQAVHRDMPAKEWTKPSTVQTLPAFVIRNHVGFGSVEPSPSTDLYPGWYKGKEAKNVKQTIDIITNKLATECTPDLAKKELDGSDPSSFSADKFVTGQANLEEKDDIHQCSDSRPSISASASAASAGSYSLVATISKGTHPLAGNGDKGAGKVNFVVNGQVVSSQDIVDGVTTYSASVTPTTSGSTFYAQVLDSVLYEATSTTSTIAPISLSFSAGTTLDFGWTGNSGTGTLYKASDGSVICVGNGPCGSVPKASVPKGSNVYVRDTSGNYSQTITVTY